MTTTRMTKNEKKLVGQWHIIPVLILLLAVSHIAKAEKILVFNVTGQPPLNTDDGRGFMDRLLREALKRTGYKLVISRQPAERGLRSANKGLIDGEMSRVKGIDKVYKNLVRVPEKIMDWYFVVFTRKQEKMAMNWQALDKRNVAFINGWKILEKNIPRTAHITKTKNFTQLFKLLAKNRTDYVIYEKWGGHKLLHDMNLSNVRILKPELAKREMFVYLHKKHQALAPRLAQAFRAMKADGSYSKIREQCLMSGVDEH